MPQDGAKCAHWRAEDSELPEDLEHVNVNVVGQLDTAMATRYDEALAPSKHPRTRKSVLRTDRKWIFKLSMSEELARTSLIMGTIQAWRLGRLGGYCKE